MTYSPQTWLDARAVFQRETGLPSVSLGIQHYEPQGGGYHEGNDLLAAAGKLDSDYSKRETSRDQPGTNGANALDVGWFDVSVQHVDGSTRRVTLRDLSRWTEANWHAADMAWCREVIYSLDGKTVKRLDRLGIRSTGDDSHLTHNHYSGFRDEENTPKAPAFERFWRDMRGGDVMTPQENERADAGAWRLHCLLNDLDEVAGGPTAGEKNAAKKARIDMEARLRAEIEALREVLASGGGDPESAAVIARIDALQEQMRQAAQGAAIAYDNDPTNDLPV